MTSMRSTFDRALMALGALLILGTLVAFATGGSDEAHTSAERSDGTEKAATSKAVTTIDIEDFKFAPPNATVKVGSKITFVNKDRAVHTATATMGSDFDTDNLEQDAKGVITVKKAGVITYICELHPFMKGKLTAK